MDNMSQLFVGSLLILGVLIMLLGNLYYCIREGIIKYRKLVTCNCMVCGKKFKGQEPTMCCSGFECGCMGMPIEPIMCSKKCWDSAINKK